MSPVRKRVTSAFSVALVVGAALSCGELRQDELDCEEAVSTLEGCCPDFVGSFVSCVHASGCAEPVYPDLGIAESDCIRRESCSTLVSSGVCARAQERGIEHSRGEYHAGVQAVCP